MVPDTASLKMRRRQFLRAATAAAAGVGFSSSVFGQVCPPKAGTVRDQLWLFSNPRDADYPVLRKRSVMSPFEAAHRGDRHVWWHHDRCGLRVRSMDWRLDPKGG
jgi:hypothetical protein